MAQNNTAAVTPAVVVRHIQLPQKPVEQDQGKPAPAGLRTRPLSSVLGAANNPEADRPVVQLKSGGCRAIARVRINHASGFVGVEFMPDFADGVEKDEDGTIRPATRKPLMLPMNQPVVGWMKLPK